MIPPALALLAWPIIAIWLFARLPRERAIIWSVLGSFLFLPSSFAIDLPGLPPFDKESLPNLILLAILLLGASPSFRFLPPHPVARVLLLLLIAGALGTVLTNSDPILIADRILQGLTPYDALSTVVRAFLVIVPFLVGWQYLSSTDAHHEILKALLAAGLAYSVLMLFEVRMSPQLHTWVYGYFPHSFAQQIRGDGFRPVVFLRHGLWVAFFAMTVVLAAAALWREARARRTAGLTAIIDKAPLLLAATGYMFVVLVLCKSLGSLLYAILFLPIVLFFSTRLRIWIALMLTLVAIGYPVLRGAHFVPTETLLDWAEAASPARAQSLGVRFKNEDRLLAHSEIRPLLGWGGWGRNRVYNAESGRDISITDGYWVITIGTAGWAGYIAIFGLLGFPVLMLWRKFQNDKAGEPEQATATLCLILAINMIELLLNSTLPPWTWLIAGALFGRAICSQETPPQTVRPDTVAASERTVL